MCAATGRHEVARRAADRGPLRPRRHPLGLWRELISDSAPAATVIDYDPSRPEPVRPMPIAELLSGKTTRRWAGFDGAARTPPGVYTGNGFWPDVAIAQLTTSYGIAVLAAPVAPLVEPTRNSLWRKTSAVTRPRRSGNWKLV